MTSTPVSDRRSLLGSGLGMAGLAMGGGMMAPPPAEAAVKKIEGASLKGPYLDLTTPHGAMMTIARLSGNLDGSTRYGWYDGYVMAVRAGGPIRNLFGFKGFSCAKLLPLPDGAPGYRKVLREVGYYYDLETGKIMDEWLNPYTNETVKVVHITNDPFNNEIRETVPPGPTFGGLNTVKREPKPFLIDFKVQGDRLIFQRHIHLYYPNALDPKTWPRESNGPMVQASEFYFHNVSIDDIQNKDLGGVRNWGTWSRVTPWLPWMLMGPTDGQLLYMTFMGSFPRLEDVPEDMRKYAEQHHPKFLEAPAQWEEPSLSSIENYKRMQKPAPVKGGV